jgi:nucleotide-binding universal stress UspA family protein
MARHVLLPLDDSDPSWAALEYIRDTESDGTVTILHVIDPARASYGANVGIPTSSEEWLEAEEEQTATLFEKARENLADGEFDIKEEVVVGKPSRVIVDYIETATAPSVDVVVIGSHGREGVARVLLGSVAEVVVRRSPVPVTVVR